MKIVTVGSASNIARVEGEGKIITDVQSAIDLMATVRYETGCDRMIVAKVSIIDGFFILSTRLAGDILQKFSNYKMRLAIVGDFSEYASQPLKDFIRESNKGKDILFLSSVDEAIERLGKGEPIQ